MARHKKPTEVTVLPLQERSKFQEWVNVHWMKCVLVAAMTCALILGSRWMKSREASNVAASWDAFAEEVAFSESPYGFFLGTPDNLSSPPDGAVVSQVAQQLEGTSVGPWAYMIAATTLAGERRYAEAKQALDVLAKEYEGHTLVSMARAYEPGSPSLSAVDHMRARIESLEAWEAGRESLFENPPVPEDSPRIAIRTNHGEIVVGLYTDHAPEHAANFVKLAEEGFYANTKIHQIQSGNFIQGGDPNSKDGTPDTWGQGSLEYTIPAENSPELSHFTGVLGAAKLGQQTESSACQFYITSVPTHARDSGFTIFGAVLEGQDVVDAMSALEVEGDRPVEAPVIEAVEIR